MNRTEAPIIEALTKAENAAQVDYAIRAGTLHVARPRALRLAATHARHFSHETLRDILASQTQHEYLVQNPHCPELALEHITTRAVNLTKPTGNTAALAREMGLTVIVARRTDQYGERARTALVTLLRQSLHRRTTETIPVTHMVIEAGFGTDHDLASVLAVSPRDYSLHRVAATHPALGPESLAKIFEKRPVGPVLKQIARRARLERNRPVRDAVLAYVEARMATWELQQREQNIFDLLVDLASTYTPAEFKHYFKILARRSPEDALRLLKAGSAERRSLVSVLEVAPLLKSTDDAVRQAALSVLHRVAPAPERKARKR